MPKILFWLCLFFVLGTKEKQDLVKRQTEKLLIGTLDGSLYFVDKLTGTLIWKANHSFGPMVSTNQITKEGETLYIPEASGEGSLFMYESGKLMQVRIF